MSISIRNSSSIAIVTAALIGSASAKSGIAEPDASVSLNTSLTTKANPHETSGPEDATKFAETIAGKSLKWTDVATVLWKKDDLRSHAVLQQILGGLDWNLAKVVGAHIVDIADTNKVLSVNAEKTLAAAREAKALELSGSVAIDWGSGLDFTVGVMGRTSKLQTQVTVAPHIVALSEEVAFDKIFHDITLYASPGEGSMALVETFNDPQVVAGYGKYKIELLITATATDDNQNGTPVKRKVSHTAILSKDPKAYLTYQPSPAEKDLEAIGKEVGENQQVQAAMKKAEDKKNNSELIPNSPLSGKPIPRMSVTDSKGQAKNTTAEFFSKEELTLIKVSFVGCPPCRLAEPNLEAIDQIDGVRGITLVVQMNEKNLEEVANGYRKETKKFNNHHEWYTISSDEAAEKLGGMSYPTYLLVDNTGKVIEVRGDKGFIFPESRIRELLAADAPPPAK